AEAHAVLVLMGDGVDRRVEAGPAGDLVGLRVAVVVPGVVDHASGLVEHQHHVGRDGAGDRRGRLAGRRLLFFVIAVSVTGLFREVGLVAAGLFVERDPVVVVGRELVARVVDAGGQQRRGGEGGQGAGQDT